MLWSLEISYALTLALAVPVAGLQARLFIFQHDCGHGSFFRSRRANNLLGFLLGVICLTPYEYWRRTHALHHGATGDLDRRGFGEIETLTIREYLAAPAWRRVYYRLYRNLFVLLTIGSAFQFFVKHRVPFDIPLSWRREWASAMWTNLVLLAVLVTAWQTIGLRKFLLVHLPIALLYGAMAVWMFYVQHQFEDTYWRRHPEWDFFRAGLEGSSFYDLPAFLHWFTGNIGFHHIHHLATKIPNYRLRRCFREVPELQKVTRLSFGDSLRCARLRLWDEEERRLVGFDALPRPASARG